MTRELSAGRLEDLEDGVPHRVEDGARAVCVVRCGANVHAIDDLCSHEDYSLAAGAVDTEECAIECWKHGSLFSLESGEPLTFPATVAVAVYPVTIDAGEVILHLPDHAPVTGQP